VRTVWSDAIAASYERYQKSLTEVETPNEVVTELKAMQDKLTALTNELKTLKEQEGGMHEMTDEEKAKAEEEMKKKEEEEKAAEDKPAEE
jgi:ppGpp synthetase/RelA/SpoT-type nucleotidyltranferase